MNERTLYHRHRRLCATDRVGNPAGTRKKVDGPMGYWSIFLYNREWNLDKIHRVCLAVVWSIPLLRSYFERTRFVVITNYHALKFILSSVKATGKLARWRLQLLEYDFEIIHRSGDEHQTSEALWRLPTEETDDSDIADYSPVMAVNTRARFRQNKLVNSSGINSKRDKRTNPSRSRSIS